MHDHAGHSLKGNEDVEPLFETRNAVGEYQLNFARTSLPISISFNSAAARAESSSDTRAASAPATIDKAVAMICASAVRIDEFVLDQSLPVLLAEGGGASGTSALRVSGAATGLDAA
jgi:hypothetical protein